MSERIFEKINPARRQFLRKLLAGAAVAAPVVATFSVEALLPDPAYAASYANCSAPAGLQPAPIVPPPPGAFAPPVQGLQPAPVDAACPYPIAQPL